VLWISLWNLKEIVAQSFKSLFLQSSSLPIDWICLVFDSRGISNACNGGHNSSWNENVMIALNALPVQKNIEWRKSRATKARMIQNHVHKCSISLLAMHSVPD
jgi:hypothetical protein